MSFSLYCIPCDDNGKMVFAEWHVWPNDAPSLGFFTPYTYMCTDCAIEAIRNGMVQVALKTERDPHDIVRVGQIKRIPLLDRKNDE